MSTDFQNPRASARGAVNDPARYVRASEGRRIKQTGARRLPGGLIPADAVAALDALLAAGYAKSRAQVIARALVEAVENRLKS